MKAPDWIKGASSEIYRANKIMSIAPADYEEIILRHFQASSKDIPSSLNSFEFKASWSEWLQFLKEKNRGKVVPDTTLRKHLRQCEKWGIQKAVSSIEQSISRNWSGLFESKNFIGEFSKKNPPEDNYWRQDISQISIEISCGATDWPRYRKIILEKSSEAPGGRKTVMEYLSKLILPQKLPEELK